MSDPQGIFYYGGIAADGACSIVRSAGSAPSQLSMRFVLGANLQPFGDVEIWYGRNRIRLPDCHVIRQKITSGNGRGRWKELLVEDRRWRWRYGAIYGEYNLYEKGTKVITPTNKKNVQEIATILLEEMGEQLPDLSLLPSDVYPPTDFDGQPPGMLLDRLVEEFGCRIVLGWDDRLSIVRHGVGQRPRDNDTRIMDYEITYEPPVIPERLIIESGRTLWQYNLPLEPVGEEEITKEIKPINELSYMPANGWTERDHMTNVVSEKSRELAQKCIWRMFRVDPPFTIPKPKKKEKSKKAKPTGYWDVYDSTLYRILPLEEKQLELYKPENKDELTSAQIIGYFRKDYMSDFNNVEPVPSTVEPDDFEDGLELDTNNPEYIYQGGFSIDTERGIITTSEPLYVINRDSNGIIKPPLQPPKIFLRTSFPFRDKENRSPLRQQYEVRPSGGMPGVVKVIRIESLTFEIGPDEQTDQTEFEKEAAYYAEQELTRINVGNESATIPARGFCFDYNVDGALRSVAFMKDESGRCTTRMEWQTEDPTYRVTYDEEKKERKIAAAVKELDQANAKQKKQRGRSGRKPVQ